MIALTLNASETEMGRTMTLGLLDLCRIRYIEPADLPNTFYLQNILIEEVGLIDEMLEDVGIIVEWTV